MILHPSVNVGSTNTFAKTIWYVIQKWSLSYCIRECMINQVSVIKVHLLNRHAYWLCFTALPSKAFWGSHYQWFLCTDYWAIISVMTMQLHYQRFGTYWACSRLFMTFYFCSCIWMQFCGASGKMWSGKVRQHPLNRYSLLVLDQYSYSNKKDPNVAKTKDTSEIRGKLLTLTLQSD